MALALDRKAFIDILDRGHRATSAAAMLPPPAGLWGMPPDMLQTLPGYDPDVAKNRAEAPRDHGKARLRARQAAQDQGVDPQHRRPTATRR